MKRYCLLFLIVSFTQCTSQKKIEDQDYFWDTRVINDSLSIDLTEVTNADLKHWFHYLLNLKKDTNAYLKALPDTTVWANDLSGYPLTMYYLRHPAFSDCPAVGFSYEQVIDYCQWRTYATNQFEYFRKNKIEDFETHINDSFPINFYFRLPTKAEWEMAAAGGFDIHEFPYGIKKKNNIFFNTLELRDSLLKTYNPNSGKTPVITTSVGAYMTNDLGLYNMIGNAAEMVAEKNIAKGGSFMHPLDSCKIHMDQYYTKPEQWLGFRCVCIRSLN